MTEHDEFHVNYLVVFLRTLLFTAALIALILLTGCKRRTNAQYYCQTNGGTWENGVCVHYTRCVP